MKYTGLNIQYPVTDAIIAGTKMIETRTYPIPPRLVGKKVVMIETPGPKGKFKARLKGFIIFGQSRRYKSEEDFYLDAERHGVFPENKQFKWDQTKGKYGWPVLWTSEFDQQPLCPKKGMVYAKDLEVRPEEEKYNVSSTMSMLRNAIIACKAENGIRIAIIAKDFLRAKMVTGILLDMARSEAMLVEPEFGDKYWKVGNNVVYPMAWADAVLGKFAHKTNRVFTEYMDTL